MCAAVKRGFLKEEAWEGRGANDFPKRKLSSFLLSLGKAFTREATSRWKGRIVVAAIATTRMNTASHFLSVAIHIKVQT